MTNLDREICLRFKEARKEKGLSQSLLSLEVGCKQSALSAFENGDSTKLSEETIRKLAEKLGVSLEQPKKEVLPPPPVFTGVIPGVVVRGYCPDCNCPSNVPYTVGDRLIFRPSRALASPNGGVRCAVCGEVLEMRCPLCGAPLNDGACCGVCGSPYVTATLPAGIDANAWAAARRNEITALRSLS